MIDHVVDDFEDRLEDNERHKGHDQDKQVGIHAQVFEETDQAIDRKDRGHGDRRQENGEDNGFGDDKLEFQDAVTVDGPHDKHGRDRTGEEVDRVFPDNRHQVRPDPDKDDEQGDDDILQTAQITRFLVFTLRHEQAGQQQRKDEHVGNIRSDA